MELKQRTELHSLKICCCRAILVSASVSFHRLNQLEWIITLYLSVQHGRSDSYVWNTFVFERPWLELTQDATWFFLYHIVLPYLFTGIPDFTPCWQWPRKRTVRQVAGLPVFKQSCMSDHLTPFCICSRRQEERRNQCVINIAQNISVRVILQNQFVPCDCTFTMSSCSKRA
jgi:hypothetical protein